MSTNCKLGLVITADDYGYCTGRNKGIVEAFGKGGVTRASLLVNSGAAEEAVVLAEGIGLPLGLHLNLSEGCPVSDSSRVRTLLNDEGLMLGKLGFREALKNGHVNLEEVQLEINAQLDRFQRITGQGPLYVDGHQHVHVLPGVCEIFCKSLRLRSIKESRLPEEKYVDKCDWLLTPEKVFNQEVILDSLKSAEMLNQYGIRFADNFHGLTTMGSNMTTKRLQRGILSAFFHPNQLNCFDMNGLNGEREVIDTLSYEHISPVNASCDRTLSIRLHPCESCDYCPHGTTATNFGEEIKQAGVSDESSYPYYKCQQDIDMYKSVCLGTESNENCSPTKSQGSFITCELMVHPGYPSQPGDPGCGGGVDRFSQSADRLAELQVITSPDMLNFYKQHNMYLIKSVISLSKM